MSVHPEVDPRLDVRLKLVEERVRKLQIKFNEIEAHAKLLQTELNAAKAALAKVNVR